MNFAKFLRTPIFKEHLRWLLVTRQVKNEIITLLADQTNDFKDKVIEEIRSNIFALLKEDI